MRWYRRFLFLTCFMLSLQMFSGIAGGQDLKPRLLVTTDIGGDPDDMQSLVRLLVTSNEFDIEGLIASASGTPGELNEAIVKPHLIRNFIDAYSKVVDNLRLHDPGFKKAEYYYSIIKAGNPNRGFDYMGKGHDTEASEWIIKTADRSDPRPLNVVIWGGQTDLFQALWKVKNTRSRQAYKKFVSGIRVYDIADQDNILDDVWETYPDLFYILNKAPKGEDKRNASFRGMYLGGNEDLTSLAWLDQNVRYDHGPLGALYPKKTWTAPNPHGAMKEGDTPSWFFFYHNGLHIAPDPGSGGWGGRFITSEKGYFNDAEDRIGNVKSRRATVWRWRPDFQNEFMARMDWCVKDYAEANHIPELAVNGDRSREALHIILEAGESLEIDLSGSSDPDGDKLMFEIIDYPEINNGASLKTIISDDTLLASLPLNTPPGTYHLILAARDDGNPSLTDYKRILLKIK